MSQKKEWPVAHIEMYNDGRTHLSFEDLSTQTQNHSMYIKFTEEIKKLVVSGLGDKLQPGRAYSVMITRLRPRPFRSSIDIEFNYIRIR